MTQSNIMGRTEVLTDGRPVLLRAPTTDDVDRSLCFFQALGPDERRYMGVDMNRRDLIERRLREAETGEADRILGLVEDEIIADGALEFGGEDWRRHLGEIRVIVSGNYRGLGLGTLLVAELYQAAQRRNVERVVVNLAAPQTVARKICDRLGLQLDAVLPNHFKDSEGNLHDLVVMSCTLDDMWKALKDFYRTDDWPDG
ncbi:MAG: GNAT family N-acetyltransferase [Planctomycetota bacterium]